MQSVDLARSCYEYACGKFPSNLELMMGLFNCYVREYSFVKQQQVGFLSIYFVFEYLLLCCGICLRMLMEQLDWNFAYCCLIFWQTAIKMYKLVGEERFLLWAVCSIQLQVLPALSCCLLSDNWACFQVMLAITSGTGQ